MFTIKRTDEFNDWLLDLKDSLTHRRLLARLRKASVGNLGDVKPGARVYLKCASTLAPAGACTTCSAAR